MNIDTEMLIDRGQAYMYVCMYVCIKAY
jgi:hypothetical protein